MDVLIDSALRRLVDDREDLFGEATTFLHFQPDHAFSGLEGYQSESLFGRILYKNANHRTCRSPPLMLKLTTEQPDSSMKLDIINEIVFYTRLLPFFSSSRDFAHHFPKYYSGQLNGNTSAFKGVIVFENLQANGYTTTEVKSFLDYEHLALLMRKLGEFHAYSYKTRRSDPVQFLALVDSFQETQRILTAVGAALIPIVGLRGVEPLRGCPEYSREVAKLEALVKASPEIVRKIICENRRNPLAVLCHGDYLRSNVMFAYADDKPVDLKFVDMASCKLASPVVDMALILYLNASQQMRDEHWDDLIDEYYGSLKSTFPNDAIPTKDDILTDFRTNALFAYFVASYFLSRLMSMDHDVPSLAETIADEYKGIPLLDIPVQSLASALMAEGGQLTTDALTNILKDMMKRGFV